MENNIKNNLLWFSYEIFNFFKIIIKSVVIISDIAIKYCHSSYASYLYLSKDEWINFTKPISFQYSFINSKSSVYVAINSMCSKYFSYCPNLIS